jgi:hypothetical protein
MDEELTEQIVIVESPHTSQTPDGFPAVPTTYTEREVDVEALKQNLPKESYTPKVEPEKKLYSITFSRRQLWFVLSMF